LPERKASTWYLYLITLVAAVGGFQFGYDLGLMSGGIVFLKTEWNLSPVLVGVVMGSLSLGCPFGPLAGAWLADTLGRNKALIVAAVLFIASALGCALVNGIWQFSFWRFIGGVGVGLASTISPMYIAEVSPARLRGRMVVINQLAIVFGILLSIIVAYFLSFGGHWRWMFASMALPAAVFLFGLFFLPRSPRWLATRGNYEEALEVLSKINGQAEAERVLAEIRLELGQESGGFRELFAPGVRLAVMIGITLMVFSQVNGVNMILSYAPTIFIEAGITNQSQAILNAVYLKTWMTLCTIAAFWLTARFGRRPILICGTIAMAAGHVLMFLRFNFALPPLVTLAGMFLAVGAFTLTLAPLSWVILSEIFPNRVRNKAMSLATMIMFTSYYITTNGFPIVLDQFKRTFGNPGGTFLIFMGICLGCSLFVWRMLPETKDKTLEEIGSHWLHLDKRHKRP
jgi:sugar porter (SP) family MFS transporter